MSIGNLLDDGKAQPASGGLRRREPVKALEHHFGMFFGNSDPVVLNLEQHGIRPIIAAEVDDMAMLRLLVRQNVGLGVVPPIVVRDELAAGTLQRVADLPGIKESFFAITLPREFPHPLLAQMIPAARETLARRLRGAAQPAQRRPRAGG